MALIRKLFVLFMQFDITFKAKHIAGIDNGIVDAISRKQWRRFRQLAPTANKVPCRSYSSNISQSLIQSEVSRLLTASNSSNTLATYKTGLVAFNKFRDGSDVACTWPPPVEQIVSFIAYLSLQGYAESTAMAYIASIRYECKIQGLDGSTNRFIVTKMLEGFRRLKSLKGIPDCPLQKSFFQV
jgi:hypothetical protein